MKEEPAEVSEDVPVGFWTDLFSGLRQELKPPVSGFFTTTPNAPVSGELRGNRVVLKCVNDFALQLVNKPEILQTVSRKASAILGRQVMTVAVDQTAKPEINDRLERLIDFGKAHSDIVNIKE